MTTTLNELKASNLKVSVICLKTDLEHGKFTSVTTLAVKREIKRLENRIKKLTN